MDDRGEPEPGRRPPAANTLAAVVAITAKNAWAFGFYEKTTTSFRTLVEHWNGAKWSVVPSPNSGSAENTLLAAAARSGSDIWAVGYHNDPGHRRTLTEHWTGSGWSVASAGSPAADYNSLQAVAATGTRNAWAVGSRRTNPGAAFRTLTERWNGSSWTAVASPSVGPGDNWLYGVAAVPNGGGFWAVGTDGNNTLTEFHC